ncbi:MAG: hypothetical protein PVF17_00525 [Ignavibacteria bacterium]|jgi:hypothetical protein
MWKDINKITPKNGDWVVVRTWYEDKAEYFQDRFIRDKPYGSDWIYAVDTYVTHWCELPEDVCSCCNQIIEKSNSSKDRSISNDR